MTLEQQVASLLMLHFPGTDPQATADFVARFQPGGLILLGDNIPQDESTIPDMIGSWGEPSGLPMVIAIDEEGGVVSRLSSDDYPSAADLHGGPPSVTEAAFRDRARLLSDLGINTNFGIIADVTDDPNSFIWQRVLGSTPDEGAMEVRAAVRGERGLVASTLKHFPGHGLTNDDSHTSVPTSDISLDDWRASAAVPFAAGVDAGAELVMFGHLVLTSVDEAPASLSARWHRILRSDLGFDGIAITDDMQMLVDSGLPRYADPVQNALRAIQTGSTMVLNVDGYESEDAAEAANRLIEGLAAAVRAGDLDSEVLEDAGLRLLEFREGLSG